MFFTRSWFGSLGLVVGGLILAMAPPEAKAQCSASTGGPIKVTRVPLDGGTEEFIGCFSGGTNFTIDLTQPVSWVDNNGAPYDWIIHIYDSSTTPTWNIGEVTISGEAADVASLAVHVSGPSQQWSDDFDVPLTLGCIDLVGVTISDSDTLAITRVSAAIGGDLGSVGIHAKQLVRIQANGTVQTGGNVTGGTIEGDLIAEGTAETTAIGHVRAWNHIAGDIEAKLGNISSVRVVADTSVTANPGGITGDILAVHGTIETIWSSGPIGEEGSPVEIKAGNGVLEVRCVALDGFGNPSVVPEDIYAHITTNLDYTPSANTTQGRLRMLQTDGHFVGSVTAANIDNTNGGNLTGIVVGGEVDAPITIENALSRSCIIGATFHQPIVIGLQSEGAIVATDEENGEIPSVSIGYSTSTGSPYDTLHRGMFGIACPPIQPDVGGDPDAFDAPDWLNPTPPSFHGGAVDSVIRAHRIGEVRISTMSTQYVGDNATARKEYMPRIEADSIGFIQIDDLREGIIWSGNLEYDSGELANVSSNDYASIEELVIGDVGPYSDVWFKDCPVAYFKGDVLGELRLPQLASDETIVIAGLLNIYTLCGCGTSYNSITCPYPEPSSVSLYCEDSPRTPGNGSDCPSNGPPAIDPCADPAAIRIWEKASDDGLAGQIIVNADNAPSLTSWGHGIIVIGDKQTLTNKIVIGQSESSPRTAPYYETRAGALGGGEIGLAPFHLQEIASFPEHASSTSRVLSSAFGAGTHALDKPVLVRHYGPVKLGTGATLSNSFAVDVRDPNDPCHWAEMTMLFDFELDTDPAEGGRTVVVKAADTAHPPTQGTYRLRRTTSTRLVCDSVDGNPPVVWPINCEGEDAEDEAYVFVIASDCNDNGRLDSLDIAEEPSLDVDPEDGIIDECQDDGCEADFDGNQLVEADDIFAFLDAWFAQNGTCTSSCSADFNGVDDVTADDIFAFLDTWFAQNGTLCDP